NRRASGPRPRPGGTVTGGLGQRIAGHPAVPVRRIGLAAMTAALARFPSPAGSPDSARFPSRIRSREVPPAGEFGLPPATSGYLGEGGRALDAALCTLPGIDLDELVGRAALQTRVDRKYLVTTPVLAAMLDALARTAAA